MPTEYNKKRGTRIRKINSKDILKRRSFHKSRRRKELSYNPDSFTYSQMTNH